MDDESIRLMHYDPRWKQEFEQTKSSLFLCSDGWITNVVHIGSTAVPGLVARPTIDVIATVEQDEGIEQATHCIEGLNYRAVTSPPWADGSITLVKPRSSYAESPESTHRVFLVTESSGFLDLATRLRDYLRENPESAIAWEETKVDCWKQYNGSALAYHRAKSKAIGKLLDQVAPT